VRRTNQGNSTSWLDLPEFQGVRPPMLDAIAVQDLRAEFEELKPRVEELRRFL
jgi:hypothetical protein